MKKDNLSFLCPAEIEGYDIDEEGNINKPLSNKAGVYIYMCSSGSHSNPKYYVGSTVNLKKRTSAHKHYTTNRG